MSANLGLAQLAESQASPEITVNDATAALDAALTEIFVADLTAADVSISIAQFRAAMLFRITNMAATAATGTLTNDGTNVLDTETIVIDGKTYTFQTTLTNVDGHVKIGASNTDSMTNLFHAINASGGTPGTDYATATTAHATVTATNPTGTTVVATAKVLGVSGNSLATTETSAHLSWAHATLTGATGGSIVTLPSVKRGMVLIESDAANVNTVSLVHGTTTLTLKPARLYAVYSDGTANSLVARDIGGTTEPNDMSVFLPGTMTGSQLCYRRKAVRAFTLPSGLSGGFFEAGTAATASTTVTLKKNGTSIGTLVWAISGTVAAVTFASSVSFAVGDVFSIEGPAVADTTLADISLDFTGSR